MVTIKESFFFFFLQGVLVSFNKQIEHHQVTMSRIHHILGKNHSNYLKQCLYLSMIGNNDYINNYFLPKYYNSSRHYTPKQYANVLVEEYAQHLKVNNYILILC